MSDEPEQAPKNGKLAHIHEFWTGLIAYTSLLGLLGITGYCLKYQPAYWEAVVSTVPILTAIVGAYTGASYALSLPRR